MSYYLAPSLDTLRTQIHQKWPELPRGAIGWIGDAAHAARPSQHNPDPDGSVDAIDPPHRPDIGLDAHLLARQAIADPRCKLVITNGQIWSRARAAEGFRKYTGANKHDKHAHIETTDEGQDDRTEWRLPILGYGPPPPTPPAPIIPLEDDMAAMISDGIQVWLTNGISKRAVTQPGDDLATIAERMKEEVFAGFAANTLKGDGVPDVQVNPQFLARIPVA